MSLENHPLPLSSPREKEFAEPLKQAQADHSRRFRNFTYVYPVISRRAGGVSVGINLNIDKLCNFNCAYCQVDRSISFPPLPVDLNLLERELSKLLEHYSSGEWENAPLFPDLPLSAQQLKDLCISGDGEATMLPILPTVLRLMLTLQQKHSSLSFKMVLITNGTGLGRSDVCDALNAYTAVGGELWIKLDAGTPDYYQRINDTKHSFEKMMELIRNTAARYPIKLQSMFCSIEGEAPTEEEIAARIDRFEEVELAGAGNLQEIQLYSLARPSANLRCTALSSAEMKRIAEMIEERLPWTEVKIY